MKIIILERDGVINQIRDTSATMEDWSPIHGSLEAIANLNQAGYRVVIAMNYPEQISGEFDIERSTQLQHQMHRSLEQVGGQLDAVFICAHNKIDQCACRMPKPGMIHDIANRYHAKLYELTLIGSSRESIEAAVSSGIRTILLRNTGTTASEVDVSGLSYTATFDTLANAANALINLEQINQ